MPRIAGVSAGLGENLPRRADIDLAASPSRHLARVGTCADPDRGVPALGAWKAREIAAGSAGGPPNTPALPGAPLAVPPRHGKLSRVLSCSRLSRPLSRRPAARAGPGRRRFLPAVDRA